MALCLALLSPAGWVQLGLSPGAASGAWVGADASVRVLGWFGVRCRALPINLSTLLFPVSVPGCAGWENIPEEKDQEGDGQ